MVGTAHYSFHNAPGLSPKTDEIEAAPLVSRESGEKGAPDSLGEAFSPKCRSGETGRRACLKSRCPWA